MLELTTEQIAFLKSSGKVVLHACPGSGKTTVVAMKLIDYLQHWTRPHQGIAVELPVRALSRLSQKDFPQLQSPSSGGR